MPVLDIPSKAAFINFLSAVLPKRNTLFDSTTLFRAKIASIQCSTDFITHQVTPILTGSVLTPLSYSS